MKLTKHHGLGNDFLVLLDLDRTTGVDPLMARALCDRRTGVGADGLIRVTPGRDGATVTMELWNADGSVAEMSGNGIRCLAQAVVGGGVVGAGPFVVATAGGPRHVEVLDTDPVRATVAVDMGPALPGPSLEGVTLPTGAERAETVSMGNPHLVLLSDDPAAVDVETAGPALQVQFPATAGINVEWIAPTVEGLDLVVFERGAGITPACGTGACAAAHAAHRWGLASDRVDVAMPGGRVSVELGDHVTLVGPAVRVASVDVDPAHVVERVATAATTGVRA